jgi:hypothetical protein
MKKLTLVLPLLALLALGIATWPRSQSNDSAHIRVKLFGDEKSTQAAVTLHDTLDADYVIVEFFYWESLQMDYSTGKNFAPLLLHKVDVVPFYRDVPIGAGSVPVPRSAVKSVNVTVVKTIEESSVQFNQEKPKL